MDSMLDLTIRRAEILLQRSEFVLEEAELEYLRRRDAPQGAFAREEIEQARCRRDQATCDYELAKLELEIASGGGK